MAFDAEWLAKHQAKMENIRRGSVRHSEVVPAQKTPEKRSDVPKRNKYGAVRTTVDGQEFDSRRESSHYEQLKRRQMAGEITDLVVDKERLRYPLMVGDVLIGYYEADFRWRDARTGIIVVADAKGRKTDVYSLKRKLMKAIYDIKIVEL